MLPSRISVPRSSELLEQEDIFDSALNALFTDDAQNCHGTPGQSVVYSSPRFGDLLLRIPIHPDIDEGRKLFAHYLWNAGIVIAAGIEFASNDSEEQHIQEQDQNDQASEKVTWEKKYWDVRDLNVLELGSGTALPSLIAALSNSRSTTITDHPSSPALTNDAISLNVQTNLFRSNPDDKSQQPVPRSSSSVSIHGYVWGESTFNSPTTYGKASLPQPAHNSFNKIVIADCLWMPSQHVNLVKTILQYLSPAATGNEVKQETMQDGLQRNGLEEEPYVNCALVTAGFHTGRATVAEFFRIATGSTTAKDETIGRQDLGEENGGDTDEVKSVKGSLKAESIFEVDVNAVVRPWLPVRSEETREQAKRWCVVAALVKR